MKYRRLLIVFGSTIMIILFGGMVIVWINDTCPSLSFNECRLMWGTTIASILGGILLTEILIDRQKAQGKWWFRSPKLQSHNLEPQNDNSNSPGWYIWIRPIAWVTLSSLLAALPLIVEGAFVTAFGGTLIGFLLDALIRGVTNRIAPIEESEES